MKVDKPRFGARYGVIRCEDCPLEVLSIEVCDDFHAQHSGLCPIDMETYLAACKLAEEAQQ